MKPFEDALRRPLLPDYLGWLSKTHSLAARRKSHTDLDEAYKKLRKRCPNIHQVGKATRLQIIKAASENIVWLGENLREARGIISKHGLRPPPRPPNNVQDMKLLQSGSLGDEAGIEQRAHNRGGETHSQVAPLEVEVLWAGDGDQLQADRMAAKVQPGRWTIEFPHPVPAASTATVQSQGQLQPQIWRPLAPSPVQL